MKVRQMPLELKELFEALKSKDPIPKERQAELINKISKLSHSEMIDICEKKRNTLLIEASRNGHDEMVHALLEAKANPNIRGEMNSLALIGASAEGHKKIVSALLKANADPNGKSDHGATPLFVAASISHNLEVMQLLIDAKADANVRTKDGETMLLYPACGNRLDVIEKLLTNGQFNNFKKEGRVELDLIVQHHSVGLAEQLEKTLSIVNLLLNKGAPFKHALFVYQFLLLCDQRQVLSSLTQLCQQMKKPRDNKDEEKKRINKEYPYNEAPKYLERLNAVMQYEATPPDSIVLERDRPLKLKSEDVETLYKKICSKQNPYSFWVGGVALVGVVKTIESVLTNRNGK